MSNASKEIEAVKAMSSFEEVLVNGPRATVAPGHVEKAMCSFCDEFRPCVMLLSAKRKIVRTICGSCARQAVETHGTVFGSPIAAPKTLTKVRA